MSDIFDLKKEVAVYLAGKEDPVKMTGMLKHMGLHHQDRQVLKSVLKELTREGAVIKTGNRYWVPEGKKVARTLKREKTKRAQSHEGRLSVAARGYGFVACETGPDWFIPEHALSGARHGDIVRARMTECGRDGRITGEVEEVISFGMHRLLGIFERTRSGRMGFLAFGDAKVARADLDEFPGDATEGQVGLWNRAADGKWTFGRYLGRMEDARVDEIVVLAEGDIETEFTPEVLTESASLSQDFAFAADGRKDFSEELVFTVDGATARDFDDAIHLRRLAADEYELGVHIADVSFFVQEGSALDRSASRRANSVYLPHKAIPMLPEILSTGLCSLNPEVPRYTLSLVARLNGEAEVVSFELFKGLIRSKYRLTYDEVTEIAVTKDPSARARDEALTRAIDMAVAFSRKMIEARSKNGGLRMDMPETSISLDENHLLKEVRQVHATDANRMIEAFMCLANECVARFMGEHEIGIPYRIHEQPVGERLEKLENFLRSFGLTVPLNLATETGRALNAIIAQIADAANAQVLQTQMLKSMQMAEYNVENRGHFGLASRHYTHFTSPIRRYADLIVHRRLSAVLADPKLGPEHFDDTNLAAVCTHLSNQEREAMKAENTFATLKLLRRMQREIGNEFEGVIEDVLPFGFFVRPLALPARGLVRVEDLNDDFYELNPALLALVGKKRRREFKVGSLLKVQVLSVDLIGRKMFLMPAGAPFRAGKSRTQKIRAGRPQSSSSGRSQATSEDKGHGKPKFTGKAEKTKGSSRVQRILKGPKSGGGRHR